MTQSHENPVYDRLELRTLQVAEKSRRLLCVLQATRTGRVSLTFGLAAGKSLPAPLDRHLRRIGPERESVVAAERAISQAARKFEKCEQRLAALPGGTVPVDLSGLAAVADQAAQLLASLVGWLHSMTELDRAMDLLGRFAPCKAECDRLGAHCLRTLFAGHFDAGTIIALKDVVDLMSEAVESCGEAAELVWRIFLENH